MSVLDDLTAVLLLACLTEDRSDEDQLALLRVADRLDLTANKATVGNGYGIEARYYDYVQGSRGSDWPRVDLPKRRGVPRCLDCGRPAGWQPPNTVDRHEPGCRAWGRPVADIATGGAL